MNLIVTLAGKSSRFAKYGAPKFMLPTKNGTMFDLSMRSLPLREFKKIIFVIRKDYHDDVKEFIENRIKALSLSAPAEIFEVDNTRGQAETAYLALAHCLEGSISVFNIDSYFYCGNILEHLKTGTAFMLHTETTVEEPIYSYAKLAGNKVIETAEKIKISNKALVGFYSFASADQYEQAFLAHALKNEHTELYIAPMYNEVLAVGADVSSYPVSTFFDVGNPEAYEEFKERYVICQSRYFNNVIHDLKEGTTTKKSIDRNKLKNEHRVYINAPLTAAKYNPVVCSFIDCATHSELKMKTVDGVTLDKVFLDDQKAAGNLIPLLAGVLADLQSLKREIFSHLDFMDMYVTKTMERYRKIPLAIKQPFSGTMKMNGKKMLGIDILYPLIIERAKMYCNAGETNYIHGDFCLSNIIISFPEEHSASPQIKLIDPRGSWGSKRSHGDKYYDIAKLRHSLVGGYDLIKANCFELTIGPKNIQFAVPNDAEVKEKFDRYFPEELERVKFIEGLLFLTMIPLHADEPRHQLAFMAQAVKIFNECFTEEVKRGKKD